MVTAGLLSEEQCKARDVRRKQKTKGSSKKGEGSPEPFTQLNDKDLEDNKANVKLAANLSSNIIIEEEPLSKVTEHTKTLVEKIVYLQDKYEFPDEQVIKSISVSIIIYFFLDLVSLLNDRIFRLSLINSLPPNLHF